MEGAHISHFKRLKTVYVCAYLFTPRWQGDFIPILSFLAATGENVSREPRKSLDWFTFFRKFPTSLVNGSILQKTHVSEFVISPSFVRSLLPKFTSWILTRIWYSYLCFLMSWLSSNFMASSHLSRSNLQVKIQIIINY